MTIADQILHELATFCAVPPQEVRRDAWLIEYGLDSVRGIELIVTLEGHFDIVLRDDEIADVTTVDDVIRVIEDHLRPTA